MSAEECDRLITKWQKWSNRIVKDIQYQLHDNEIFIEYRDMVFSNKAIQSPFAFHDWTFRNYVVNSAISIRRIADYSHDTHSLWRLLFELLKYPNVFTRSHHRKLYVNVPQLADPHFDDIAGTNKRYLSSRMIRGDLRKLENGVYRIRRFTNKRISHITDSGRIKKIPEYGNIQKTLAIIESIAIKYHAILTAEGFAGLKPTRQYNWKAIFQLQWLSDD